MTSRAPISLGRAAAGPPAADRLRLVLRAVGHVYIPAACGEGRTGEGQRRLSGAQSFGNHLKPYLGTARPRTRDGRLPRVVPRASLADARRSCQFPRARIAPTGGTAGRRIRVLLPLPLPEALDYLAPRGRGAAGARHLCAGTARAAQPRRRGLGRAAGDELPRRAAEAGPRDLAGATAAARAAPLCRARRRLHDGAARRGAAHGDERPGGAAAAAAATALRGFRRPALAALAESPAGRRLPPARRRVLERLRDGPPMPAAELARLAGCGAGVVRGLLAAGPRRGAIRPGRAARTRAARLALVRPRAVARPVGRGAAAGRDRRGRRVRA